MENIARERGRFVISTKEERCRNRMREEMSSGGFRRLMSSRSVVQWVRSGKAGMNRYDMFLPYFSGIPLKSTHSSDCNRGAIDSIVDSSIANASTPYVQVVG